MPSMQEASSIPNACPRVSRKDDTERERTYVWVDINDCLSTLADFIALNVNIFWRITYVALFILLLSSHWLACDCKQDDLR